mmetsp:Transcript_23416/g.50581  ORF Transcript_23416/g.50581 Transcript_23416/m.50581 type:complete len:669 (+) Transcript_23416:271-2277(+)
MLQSPHRSPPPSSLSSSSSRRGKNYFSTSRTTANTDIVFNVAYTTPILRCRKRNDEESCRRRRRRRRRHNPTTLLSCYSSSSPSVALFLFQLVLIASPWSASSSSEPSSPFRIVIDAGSTGSRLHIFEMVTTTVVSANNSDDNSSSSEKSMNTDFTQIECLRRGTSKVWTPMSAFASSSSDLEDSTSSSTSSSGTIVHNHNPKNATHVAHHMLPLFDYASIIIPTEFHPSTPVRIAATAGMRLFPPEEQTRVYDALYEGLFEQVATGQFAFTNLKRGDVVTLNGEREGYFGAVAANYLRGVVDAKLRVIVPPEEDEVEGGGDDDDHRGLCTNKFGMCEQDAENVVFGPSHHYVSHNMHDVKRHGPLGALDMGGSSTQIVYRNTGGGGGSDGFRNLGANASEKEDHAMGYEVPSHLHDEEFFSTSYLSYGADQFRERLWDLWVSEAEENSPNRDYGGQIRPIIFNPCSFVGYQMSYKEYILLGTGNAILCAEQINRLIPHHENAIALDELYDENIESSRSKEKQHPQITKRKMVGGVEHPPLTGKFYGMSLYFFTLDCLRELSDPDHPIHVSWPTPSIEELTHALDAFCARKWQGDLEEVQHEAHEHTRAEVLPHRCVEAVYMVTLLRDGFGFHLSSRDITFTQWVSGNEVEWSLGMVLSEFASEEGRE